MTAQSDQHQAGAGQLIGYGRVSTQDQKLELQLDALRRAGCRKIYTDKMSGTNDARPGLLEAMAAMQPGDTLVIWKLSRLSRSAETLIATEKQLKRRGIFLMSLEEKVDTSTAVGKFYFIVLAGCAQLDRDYIVENTMAGLAAARARGRVGGRRRLVLDEETKARLRAFRDAHPAVSVWRICAALAVSRATYYRYLEILRVEETIEKDS
jgi:DNA invertase Pin-like site-specific DNA recombinase